MGDHVGILWCSNFFLLYVQIFGISVTARSRAIGLYRFGVGSVRFGGDLPWFEHENIIVLLTAARQVDGRPQTLREYLDALHTLPLKQNEEH